MRLYLYSLLYFLSTVFGVMMYNNYKIYGLTMGYSDRYLTILGATRNITDSISRLAWGLLYDHFKFKTLTLISLIV